MISRSHDDKISVCQQFCLTGTVIGIVERVKEKTCMGYRFVPKYNYTTGKSYTSILQETVC